MRWSTPYLASLIVFCLLLSSCLVLAQDPELQVAPPPEGPYRLLIPLMVKEEER